jgi:hypothetical protein
LAHADRRAFLLIDTFKDEMSTMKDAKQAEREIVGKRLIKKIDGKKWLLALNHENPDLVGLACLEGDETASDRAAAAMVAVAISHLSVRANEKGNTRIASKLRVISNHMADLWDEMERQYAVQFN